MVAMMHFLAKRDRNFWLVIPARRFITAKLVKRESSDFVFGFYAAEAKDTGFPLLRE